MERKDQINKLKDNLKKLLSFGKEKFNNYTLSDGTNVVCDSDEIAAGSEVYQIDADGNKTPLDNGDYVLQDGRTFTVADNKVSVISEAAPSQDDTASPAEPTDAAPEQQKKMTDDGQPEGQKEGDGEPSGDGATMEDLATRVENLEKQLAEVLNLVNQSSDGQNEVNEQMMSKIKEIAEASGDEPIKSKATEFSNYTPEKYSKASSEEALRTLRENMAKRRAGKLLS